MTKIRKQQKQKTNIQQSKIRNNQQQIQNYNQ